MLLLIVASGRNWNCYYMQMYYHCNWYFAKLSSLACWPLNTVVPGHWWSSDFYRCLFWLTVNI